MASNARSTPATPAPQVEESRSSAVRQAASSSSPTSRLRRRKRRKLQQTTPDLPAVQLLDDAISFSPATNSLPVCCSRASPRAQVSRESLPLLGSRLGPERMAHRLFDLNCTPPDKQEDDQNQNDQEMEDQGQDQDQGMEDNNDQEMEDINDQEMEDYQNVEMDAQDAGGQQAVRRRKSLNDQQRFAAYVAMHFQCMKNGGKFKKMIKKI